MSAISRKQADIGGRKISMLRGGPDAEPVLFLHGGVPGQTLYCSGAHMWADYLPLAARERHVVAPDLPGFGDSAAGAEPYGIDPMARTALALIEALKLGPCHSSGMTRAAWSRSSWRSLRRRRSARSRSWPAPPRRRPATASKI